MNEIDAATGPATSRRRELMRCPAAAGASAGLDTPCGARAVRMGRLLETGHVDIPDPQFDASISKSLRVVKAATSGFWQTAPYSNGPIGGEVEASDGQSRSELKVGFISAHGEGQIARMRARL